METGCSQAGKHQTTQSWLPGLLRVVIVLLTFHVLMVYGTAELFIRIQPEGAFLVKFGDGWSDFSRIALAMWLTWGGGRMVARLIAVLTLVGLTFAGVEFFQLNASAGLPYVTSAECFYMLTAVLGLHAVAFPFRSQLGRKLSFQQPHQTGIAGHSPSRTIGRVKLVDAMAWITFLAIALAVFRLHILFLDQVLGRASQGRYWFSLVSQFAAALLSVPFVAVAVWRKNLSLWQRVLLIAVAFAFVFGCQAGAYFGRTGSLHLIYLPDLAVAACGTVTAALVTFALLRNAGAHWTRDV